jgi:predicted  nucleic acid-binding Zn-ribbon protein
MAQDCKPKNCIDCGNEFKPTSNVQKRCPKCMVIHLKKKNHENLANYRKRKIKSPVIDHSQDAARYSAPEIPSDAGRFIQLTVAEMINAAEQIGCDGFIVGATRIIIKKE